jgi:hypothetical protein
VYRQLDPERIVETVERLQRRIGERFPGSGLSGVAGELLSVAREAKATATLVARPLLALRFALGLAIGALVIAAAAVAVWIALHNQPNSWTDFAQGLDATLNLVILIGAAVFSLVTLEVRIKRRRALKAVYELRVLAHVVEMHQLTKDPERLLFPGQPTPSSPLVSMTPFELTRYLDYCSDMLAVISNLAALYAQRYDDPVALDAVDAIERLTTGISQKIWQKMMILNTTVGAERPGQS